MRLTKAFSWVLAAVICAGMVTAVRAYREGSASATAEASVQDFSYLDRRITSLEQKLYTIESSLRRMEQTVSMQRPSSVPAPTDTARDPAIGLLRSEIELLKGRVRALECGLVRLDERTLSASVRGTRGQIKDPCRQNPEMPVQLSTRQ